MSGVELLDVAADDDDVRLDRWCKRHLPGVPHGRLEKLLRTGQIRVDGKRAKGNLRLRAGQQVRLPPVPTAKTDGAPAPQRQEVTPDMVREVRAMVRHRDDAIIVIDKPAGLAVQGGSGTHRHLDGMLDALKFDAPERPRLVHRLDKDTSGVLVLARSASVARALARTFQTRDVDKTYWALVAGMPPSDEGTINMALGKQPGSGGEKMGPDAPDAKPAVTEFRVIDRAGARVAWLELKPVTGRTHQLRAHCAFTGMPILGDGKYGGADAFVGPEQVARRLHLHARAIALPHPAGHRLRVTAPLPAHMKASFDFFEFDPKDAE